MIRIKESHDTDGSIRIEGYVKNINHPIISISNSRGYWKVEGSSSLPVEIDQAQFFISCYIKVIQKWREYRDNF